MLRLGFLFIELRQVRTSDTVCKVATSDDRYPLPSPPSTGTDRKPLELLICPLAPPLTDRSHQVIISRFGEMQR